jgi:hypothetical protein
MNFSPLLLLLSSFAVEEPASAAEAYLKALAGTGDDRARELLLGGATMDAQLSSLENWRIVSKEPLQTEEGDLRIVFQLISDLDRAARVASREMLNGQTKGTDFSVSELSQADAAKLLLPTQERAQRLTKAYPLLAHVARVGKEIYWHPKNPIRPLLAKAGKQGKYSLQFQRFKIETLEGPRQVAHNWPLRVLRFRTHALDTGWKILPASDWSPD